METLTLCCVVTHYNTNVEHTYMKQIIKNTILLNLSTIINNFINKINNKQIDDILCLNSENTCFLDFTFEINHNIFMKRIIIGGKRKFGMMDWCTDDVKYITKIISEINEAYQEIKNIDEEQLKCSKNPTEDLIDI